MSSVMSSLPPEIKEVSLAQNYPALQIETEQCSATLALHGAHLTHWQPAHTAHPVLYTSPSAIYREGKAIRGGIPICWPWFNAHPTAPDKHPSHGVARNQFWKLTACSVENGQVKIILTLPATPEISAHVPFAYELEATFLIGTTCSINLTTINRSSQNQPLGGALHTYLALSNISKTHITGLQNTPYLDTTVTPEETNLQEEENLIIAEEVDRIYYGTENTLLLKDSQWNRVIEVSKENSLSTVIWNPWLEKATALADMPNEGFESFVCIEASNARHDTRILAPSASQQLCTTLAVNPL